MSATIEEMPLSAVMGVAAPASESQPAQAVEAMPAQQQPAEAAEGGEASLVVSLGSFEGPIDLLLHLARDQKVDLAQISILQLVEQYLAYIDQAHQLRLEVAADYLVMAAWLAYLKSRLLLPKQEQAAEEAMSGDELAAVLAWQIRRLEAMQKAAADLIALPQMGYNTFARGMRDDGLVRITHEQPTATIYDLMSAYADIKRRTDKPPMMKFAKMELFSIEEAVERLRGVLGEMPTWTTLANFLPREKLTGVRGRSALAATLIASLELAKQGMIEVRQDTRYGPIFLRRVGAESTSYTSSYSESGAVA